MTPERAASEAETSTELRRGSERPPERADCSFVVEVTEGANRGARITVEPADPSRVLVGTSPACQLRLTDRQVSRRHAALEVAGDCLRLTDLGSTNGTTVHGLGVVEVFLKGGETVRMGDTVLRVARLESSPPSGVPTAMRFGRVVGGSFAMRRLYPLCERLAASEVPVVIEGETGTGKEQLAEALHELGARAKEPFVVFDCTAVGAGLLESVLFGHERGAFTNAVTARKGVFELADGGTLFIDEIGDLDLPLQAKLLRAIERQEVQRLGAERWLRVNVRVIAATRRDLDQEVQEGRFRDDLFFRLAVARIELPPLRKREGDIGLLARHFWRTLGGQGALPEDFLRRLESYPFPGNVRELHNTILRRLSLGDVDPLGAESTGEGEALRDVEAASLSTSEGSYTGRRPEDTIDRILSRDLPFPRARDEVVAEFERRFVERLLARYGGSVSRAAAASGVAMRYFQLIRARAKGK